MGEDVLMMLTECFGECVGYPRAAAAACISERAKSAIPCIMAECIRREKFPFLSLEKLSLWLYLALEERA